MSDQYIYTDLDGDELKFRAETKSGRVIVTARGGIGNKTVYLPNADVPTVAAELLKAAGLDDLAALIESAAQEAAEKAEAEAAEKKLQERRDALLREFNAGARWDHASEFAQIAIDRIIEVQDKAATS